MEAQLNADVARIDGLEMGYEHLEGLKIQYFDPIRDAEGVDETTKESWGAKGRAVAKTVATNMAIGAVTNVPGIAFGVGSAVCSVGGRAIHTKLSKDAPIVCSVTLMKLIGGYERPKQLFGRKMSPYMTAEVKMEGLPPQTLGGIHYGKTKPAKNVGTTLTFEPEKYNLVVGLPMTEAARTACLLIKVIDEPEARATKLTNSANLLLGSAALTLAQLMKGLEDNEEVSCEVNLMLHRGRDNREQQGVLRVRVDLARN